MKILFIWLAIGSGLVSMVACNPSPTSVSPAPNVASFSTQGASQRQDDIIDKAVISALTHRHEIPVIIELRQPTSVTPEILSDDERTKQIKITQELVLNTLALDEFRLKYRSDIIFILVGWVTKQGLLKLSRNPYVVKVSLDGVNRGSLH